MVTADGNAIDRQRKVRDIANRWEESEMQVSTEDWVGRMTAKSPPYTPAKKTSHAIRWAQRIMDQRVWSHCPRPHDD